MNERPRYLGMLAEEDRRAGASTRVKRLLRAKVRERRLRRMAWMGAWPALAAAALGLAFFVRPVPEQVLPPLARYVPEVPAMALQVSRRPASALPSAAVSPPGRMPLQRFYELAYAPPEMLAHGQIIRVRVPRATLLSFGLPLNAYRPAAGKVEADVIFTEDGIARAIRFVPQPLYQGVQ